MAKVHLWAYKWYICANSECLRQNYDMCLQVTVRLQVIWNLYTSSTNFREINSFDNVLVAVCAKHTSSLGIPKLPVMKIEYSNTTVSACLLQLTTNVFLRVASWQSTPRCRFSDIHAVVSWHYTSLRIESTKVQSLGTTCQCCKHYMLVYNPLWRSAITYYCSYKLYKLV